MTGRFGEEARHTFFVVLNKKITLGGVQIAVQKIIAQPEPDDRNCLRHRMILGDVFSWVTQRKGKHGFVFDFDEPGKNVSKVLIFAAWFAQRQFNKSARFEAVLQLRYEFTLYLRCFHVLFKQNLTNTYENLLQFCAKLID